MGDYVLIRGEPHREGLDVALVDALVFNLVLILLISFSLLLLVENRVLCIEDIEGICEYEA